AVLWWVIAERRWRIIAGGVAVFVPTLAILSVLWQGWLPGYRAALAEPPLYWATPTLGCFVRLFFFPNAPQAQFLPSVIGAQDLLIFAVLRRPPTYWKADLAPLLLLSIPTAAYGWTFDQVVLLVPYLAVILWLVEKGYLSVAQRAVALGGLVLIAAGMVFLNVNRVENVFFFWCPWALAAVYFYVWYIREPQPKVKPA